MRIFAAVPVLMATLLVPALTGCNGCGNSPDAAAQARLNAQAQAQANAQTQALLAEEARLADQQRLAAQAELEKKQAAQAEQERFRSAIDRVVRKIGVLFDTPNLEIDAAVKGVQDADISDCPPDFRTAYVDFESSLENLSQVNSTRADFDSDDNAKVVLGETIISAFANSNAAPLQKALDRDDQLKQQQKDAQANVLQRIQALQKVAALYGVT